MGAKVIGIVGVKGAGKTYTAQLLKEELGDSAVLQPMAKPLKELATTLFGFTHEQVYGADKEKSDPYWGFSARYAQQIIGTELFRHRFQELVEAHCPASVLCDQTFWLACAERARQNYADNQTMIVDDIRFEDELCWVQQHGKALLLIPEDYKKKSKKKTAVTDIHASEVLAEGYTRAFKDPVSKERCLRTFKHIIVNSKNKAYCDKIALIARTFK